MEIQEQIKERKLKQKGKLKNETAKTVGYETWKRRVKKHLQGMLAELNSEVLANNETKMKNQKRISKLL